MNDFTRDSFIHDSIIGHWVRSLPLPACNVCSGGICTKATVSVHLGLRESLRLGST